MNSGEPVKKTIGFRLTNVLTTQNLTYARLQIRICFGFQRPIKIHRALFGSIERFFGLLTEHYAGAFPAWLSPVQVVGIPITADQVEFLQGVEKALRAKGIRAEVDASDDRMQKKIRTHTTQKVPFLLLAGAKDAEAGAVSFRFRSGEQDNGVPVAEAITRITEAVQQRTQV